MPAKSCFAILVLYIMFSKNVKLCGHQKGLFTLKSPAFYLFALRSPNFYLSCLNSQHYIVLEIASLGRLPFFFPVNPWHIKIFAHFQGHLCNSKIFIRSLSISKRCSNWPSLMNQHRHSMLKSRYDTTRLLNRHARHFY